MKHLSTALQIAAALSAGPANASDVLRTVLTFVPDDLLDEHLVKGGRVKKWGEHFAKELDLVVADRRVTVRELLNAALVAYEQSKPKPRAKRRARR